MAIFSFLAQRKRKKKLVIKEKCDIIGEKKGRITREKIDSVMKKNRQSIYYKAYFNDKNWIYISDLVANPAFFLRTKNEKKNRSL